MHSGSLWTYAPRPAAWPVLSTAALLPGARTMRIRAALPASPRQPTQVRAGSWGGFAIGVTWLDVDAKTGQLGREAGILTVPADRKGQLSSGHQHGRGPGRAVDGNGLRFRRTQRGCDERLRVVGPRDDVHVLVGQLAEDGSMSHAFRTDAGADRVESRLGRRDRDLRAKTRLARDRTDQDGPGFDLGHLGL